MKNDIQALNEKAILSRKETALFLGLHVNTLDRANIPCTKIGRRTVYQKSVLVDWLNSHSKGACNE